MNTVRLNHYSGKYDYARQFFDRTSEKVSQRFTHLEKIQSDPNILAIRKSLSKKGSSLPTLSKEVGILARVNDARMSKFVRSVDRPSKADFLDSLSNVKKETTKRVTFKGDIKRLLHSADHVRRKCKFSGTKFKRVSLEISKDYLNASSNSGYPYMTKQSAVVNEILNDATVAFNDSTSNLWYDPTICGFRVQLRRKKKSVVVKTRTIFMIPSAVKLNELTFFLPFIEHFKSADTFYVTAKTGKQISGMLKKHFQNTGPNYRLTSTDFSKYDIHIIPEVIIAAFWILRSQLHLTKQEAICFENIVTYFITSFVSSNVKGQSFDFYLKQHGLPSGSVFTNMIGTLCHAIMLEYIDSRILETSYLCSDDNIFLSSKIDLIRYQNILKELFNMTLTIQNYTHNKNFFFLGFNWLNFIRKCDPILSINQCIYHSTYLRHLSAFDREVSRCASILTNSEDGPLYFAKLFPDIMSLLRLDINIRYFQVGAPLITSPQGLRIPKINHSLNQHLLHGWELK